MAAAVTVPASAQPSRLYDKDVKQLLDQSKQTYERFWSALKTDKATPEASRKAKVADVKSVGEAATQLGSAIKARKPASAQVTTLLAQSKKAGEIFAAGGAANAAQGPWARVNGQLELIAAAFLQPR